jgi:hypothetical protein
MSAAEDYAARIDAVTAQQARLRIERPELWNMMARRFRADPRRPLDGVLRFLASYLQPSDVFIDAGGGAGRLSLPLALLCREVINVEPAPGMRAEFEQSAAEAGINNAKAVASGWPPANAVTGDLAMAAHVTYFVRNVRPFLAQLHEAARRRTMLLIGSVPPPNMSARLFQVIHGEAQAPVPGHQELLAVLWEMGLLPEVRVLPDPPRLPEPPNPDRAAAIAGALAANSFAGDERGARAIEENFDELFPQTAAGYSPAWMPVSRTMVITWEA